MLLSRHAELILPPAGKGTTKMTSTQEQDTKRVANVRKHMERVIPRLAGGRRARKKSGGFRLSI